MRALELRELAEKRAEEIESTAFERLLEVLKRVAESGRFDISFDSMYSTFYDTVSKNIKKLEDLGYKVEQHPDAFLPGIRLYTVSW